MTIKCRCPDCKSVRTLKGRIAELAIKIAEVTRAGYYKVLCKTCLTNAKKEENIEYYWGDGRKCPR